MKEEELQANNNIKRCICAHISNGLNVRFGIKPLQVNPRRDIATTMQSPDYAVCRGLVDIAENDCVAEDDVAHSDALNSHQFMELPNRQLAPSLSSSSSLSLAAAVSTTAAAIQHQQYANVAEIMVTSKKYDSNQVCFSKLLKLNFQR